MSLVALASCSPPPATVAPAALAPEPQSDGRTRFGFPVAEREELSNRIGVDHDLTVQTTGLAGTANCTDYLGRGFPFCYDEHHGTDYILHGGFDAMDAGSLEVHAAFDGVVIEAVDGNYDRCHIDVGSVTCDGYPMEANRVVIEHADGVHSLYWHLKNGSVLVEVGDTVACGDPLGRIGSSGNSSMPHLHFQVEVPPPLDSGVSFEDVSQDDYLWVDPYAGPFSQPDSYWEEQGLDGALPEPGCTL